MHSKTMIAIVDPYSSGVALAREAKLRGQSCWMVQSSIEIPRMYRSSFCPENFDEIVRYRGNLEETCAMLKAGNVGTVVAGCEMGVELSDHLGERLGLISNGTRLTQARRNKALMREVLQRNGVRTPASFSSQDWDAVNDWVRQHGQWPLVIKPLCSSGSDGVSLCHSEADLHTAFDRIMNQSDVFGSANDAVLVQEFLTGTEYAVDTVSCSGQHKVVAFWQYGKNLPAGAFFGSDSLELLRYSVSLNDRLFPYVASVLDALEIQNGPAHCELIDTGDGPVIVEIGARLNGGNNPMLSRYGGGPSQIDFMLDACLEPQRFLSQLDRPYELPNYAMRVFLIPRQPGRLASPPSFDEIESLESFQEIRFSATPGQTLSRIAGWVLLVHPHREVIHRDLQAIRRLEAAGLYPMQPQG